MLVGTEVLLLPWKRVVFVCERKWGQEHGTL